jgi:hypothetical protein
LKVSPGITEPNEAILMMKAKLSIGALAVAGLVVSPLAAEAKSQKHTKHHSSMNSSSTTGANMKSDKGNAANPSSQGNVGPGTNNNNGPASGGR